MSFMMFDIVVSKLQNRDHSEMLKQEVNAQSEGIESKEIAVDTNIMAGVPCFNESIDLIPHCFLVIIVIKQITQGSHQVNVIL